jgi:protein tyrosine/serine phosphatase
VIVRRRRLIVLAALLLLAGLAVLDGWRQSSWDNFGVVEPGRIYRSGRLRPAQLRAAIESYGLRTVVNLSAHDDRPGDVEEESLVRERGLTYLGETWPGDGVVPPEKLRWVAGVLADPAKQPILVHCARGTYRTGAAIASVRILRQGWSLESARGEMERYGFDPAKQPGLAELIEGLARSAPQGPGR